MKIWQTIERNRFQVSGAIAAGAILVFGMSCQPTTTSPLSGENVDSRTLGAEIDTWNIKQRQKKAEIDADFEAAVAAAHASATAGYAALDIDAEISSVAVDAAYTDLEQQAETRGFFLGIVESLAETHLAPLLAVAGFAGVLGFGADNIRKNMVIERKRIGNA